MLQQASFKLAQDLQSQSHHTYLLWGQAMQSVKSFSIPHGKLVAALWILCSGAGCALSHGQRAQSVPCPITLHIHVGDDANKGDTDTNTNTETGTGTGTDTDTGTGTEKSRAGYPVFVRVGQIPSQALQYELQPEDIWRSPQHTLEQSLQGVSQGVHYPGQIRVYRKQRLRGSSHLLLMAGFRKPHPDRWRLILPIPDLQKSQRCAVLTAAIHNNRWVHLPNQKAENTPYRPIFSRLGDSKEES